MGTLQGHSKDAAGNPVTTSAATSPVAQTGGRDLEVVLDAGANEPAAAGDCCKLPNS